MAPKGDLELNSGIQISIHKANSLFRKAGKMERRRKERKKERKRKEKSFLSKRISRFPNRASDSSAIANSCSSSGTRLRRAPSFSMLRRSRRSSCECHRAGRRHQPRVDGYWERWHPGDRGKHMRRGGGFWTLLSMFRCWAERRTR